MCVFDSCYRGLVELWSKGAAERVDRVRAAYFRSFYLHFPDPHAHWEMVEALESLYGAFEYEFRTVYGVLSGYKVYARQKGGGEGGDTDQVCRSALQRRREAGHGLTGREKNQPLPPPQRG